MKGFNTQKEIVNYKFGKMIPISLVEDDSGKITSPYGVFELTQKVSENIDMIINHKYTGDCHYFAWAIATGTIAIDTGIYPLKYLETYGLENIGTMKLLEESIKSEYKDLSRKLGQLESQHATEIVYNYNEEQRFFHYNRVKERLAEIEKGIDSPEFQNPRYIELNFQKYDSLTIGDLLVKHKSSHHSMIYLGNHQIYGPIFISRIGQGGALSIHTFGQISEYFYNGTYSIFRERNTGVENNIDRKILKVPLAKGDYAPLYSFF